MDESAEDKSLSLSTSGPLSRRVIKREGHRLAAPCVRVRQDRIRLRSVVFSPDSSRIAIGGSQGTLILLDSVSCERIASHSGRDEDDILSISFSPDGARIISGSHLGFAMLHETSTLTVLCSTRCGNSWEWIHGVLYSPSGKYVVTGERTGQAHLRDSSTLAILQTFDAYRGPILSVTFVPDGLRIICGYYDGAVYIWDLQGEVERVFSVGSPARSIACSLDGEYVVATSDNGDVKLWDVSEGVKVGSLPAICYCTAFSPDGKYIACGGKNGTVYLWEPSSETIHELKGHTEDCILWAIAISGDSSLVASVGDDGSLRLWDSITLLEDQVSTLPQISGRSMTKLKTTTAKTEVIGSRPGQMLVQPTQNWKDVSISGRDITINFQSRYSAERVNSPSPSTPTATRGEDDVRRSSFSVLIAKLLGNILGN